MEYIVPATKTPTYFNDDAAVGAVIGGFFGNLIPIPFAGMAIGAGIGGYIGNQRMERELKDGRIIKPPSLINKKIATGILIGSAIGAVLGIALIGSAFILGGIAIATATVGVIGGVLGGTAGIAAAVLGCLGAAAAIFGPIVGGIKGAISGKAKMAQEYNDAISHNAPPTIRMAVQPGQTKGMEFDNPITPGKSFAADVAASKQVNTPGIAP